VTHKEALQRCIDCWNDGEGHDVMQSVMKELEACGYVVRSKRPGYYHQITPLGMELIEEHK
jgi:predicted transcriptional regulator